MSKGSPVFKSQKYWGIENTPRYLNRGYNHPLEERIIFFFLGPAMVISLAEEYISRAH